MVIGTESESPSDTVRGLPPRPRIPRRLQAVGFNLKQRWTVEQIAARYKTPAYVFGKMVVVCDPGLIREIYTADPARLGTFIYNLSEVFGPGSVFDTDGAEHRQRRKVLTPPFHGKSLKSYEQLILEETEKELATWPEGVEFESWPSMNRITLNVILRVVIGPECPEMERLRVIMPEMVTVGSRLWALPIPNVKGMPFNPWDKFQKLRAEFDVLIESIINRVESDPLADERGDVLSILLRSTYADGQPITHAHIADEILTLLAAGHETTAAGLAWAVERLRRHPDVLATLQDEARSGGSTVRQAAINETLRVRPVIGSVVRSVCGDYFDLGPWRIPNGYTVVMSVGQMHDDPAVFPEPREFKPERFIGKPLPVNMVPFGGGLRRCVGAALASLEIDVVLRTMLTQFDVLPTTKRSERTLYTGVAPRPKRGAIIEVRRRKPISNQAAAG